MSRMLLPFSVTAMVLGSGAFADVPNVATDIAPVHSLVARVMEGVGAPNLIVQSGASPHEYSLRPSEAAALQNANLVFWIGKDLTPWMDDALRTLATNATVTTLLETDETKRLEFREGALFEAHDHSDHDEEEHDGHEDHDDHDHGEAKTDEHDHEEDGHDDHGEEDHAGHDDHEGHDHGAHDPHAWLSLENANAWVNVIAGKLSAEDPDNAGTYFANAAAARAEMQALSAEINATLDPVRGGSFIVFHDAYQYFEDDFDLPAAGAISVSDASDPSPARIAEIQGRIRAEGIDCVLAEPQFNTGLIATVLDGVDARTGVIDPLGAELAPGAGLYPQLIRNMANTLAECL
ncbi:MAG: zinc ABC transporter substrate-binding protein [Sulfitobacter sp.]